LTLGLSVESGSALERHRALLLVTASIVGAGFVAWQARARWPLISLSLFRRRPFAAANAANLFIGAAPIVALVEVRLWPASSWARAAPRAG
jgi:hypothetical protein